MELYYHLMHWNVWFKQLIEAGGEAKERMEAAIEVVRVDFGDVLSLGPLGEDITRLGLIEKEEHLKKRFQEKMTPVFESLGLLYNSELGQRSGKGRQGEHTEDLQDALKTLSEVYDSNPVAVR